MGLQQFERRLERLVESMFARAFRGNLQPVEIGRRLTREMDLRRTMAPRGTIAPNRFTVVLSTSDRDRFAPIEGELISELEDVAREHADAERYVLLGPVAIKMETDDDLAAGMVLVSGEMVRISGDQARAAGATPGFSPRRVSDAAAPDSSASRVSDAAAPDSSASRVSDANQASLVLPDGHRVELGTRPLIVGRLPDSGLVLTDPNVSRYHAEVRLVSGAARDLRAPEYEVCDMGSTNGTRLNGVAIRDAQVLHHGDTITVGATTIRFERS